MSQQITYSPESITVITITRHRPTLLRRCIGSVLRQDYDGEVRHLIVADDCPDSISAVSALRDSQGQLRGVLARRSADDCGGPVRLARLRNYAAKLVDTPWLTFLDDDNEYEPEHLRVLMDCAVTSGSPAVHGYRKLYYFDGRPFLEETWPWCRIPEQGRQRYRELKRLGMLTPGSNIMKDRANPKPGPAHVMQVDTNVWLLRTELLRQHPIPENFSYQDWLDNLAEDDKLLEALVTAMVPIVCTDRATVKYYLGGYSNDFDRQFSHSELWCEPLLP